MNTLLYGLQSSAQCLESEWVWVGERTKQTFSTLESSTTPEHLQTLEAEKPYRCMKYPVLFLCSSCVFLLDLEFFVSLCSCLLFFVGLPHRSAPPRTSHTLSTSTDLPHDLHSPGLPTPLTCSTTHRSPCVIALLLAAALSLFSWCEAQ
ncbi:hypothetical protein DPX16_20288 [Anabarilius grahami]|uniref:Uncharacterized protein n=1 Tax=Anabarilius grahami TaxID=495550 RepID=A0A3N0Z9B1_ANAGA|nr:hypothetical protein DPX16_20288 [Anabarilius grahami]